MKKKLTPKQQMFVHEYLIDLNATRAAIRAGYSEKTASSQAERLLRKVDVSQAVAAGKEKRAKKINIDAEYVLEQLASFQKAHISELLDDSGDLLPPKDWPVHWQRMVNGIDVISTQSEDGTVTITHKVKLMDRARVMDMLGKHVDVGAFAERKIIERRESFADTLAARRSRAQNQETVH